MTLWRFVMRRGPSDWIKLEERCEGDVSTALDRCHEPTAEHGHLVNAVSVDAVPAQPASSSEAS